MRELRERAGQMVRVLCLLLAALVVYELAGMAIRWNPFRGVTVPELPGLTAATNNPSVGAPTTNLVAATAGKGTNTPSRQPSTNSTPSLATANTNSITNSLASTTLAEIDTNRVAPAGTNTATNLATVATTVAATTAATNATANAVTNVVAERATNAAGTNVVPAMLSTNQGTNLAVSATATGTNAGGGKPKQPPSVGAAGAAMAGMGVNPAPMSGKRGADLPPAVQSRIHQITESEILAAVVHPLPMALLGIAGNVAFLRSASGQTGLVKEGDSLDDLKLLRIGINRVLIEQAGQKKELMIFSGYGGESLLPKETSHENNHP